MLNRGMRRLTVRGSLKSLPGVLLIIFEQVSIDEIRAHNRELADG